MTEHADDRLRILDFRARGHNLEKRLPRSDLAAAVGAIGIRHARGSAILSVHARVEAVTQALVDDALTQKTILDVISARGTDTLVPAEDFDVFTVGTLPADEESLRVRLKPFLAVLDRSGYSALDALERAKDVARRTLSSGPVDIAALSGALTRALPELSPMCRGRCGVAHIEQLLFDLVGESGVWRHEWADGIRLYVAMEEPPSREEARAELVRRYLRCYGPSTATHFGEWCGISRSDATTSLHEAGAVRLDKLSYVLPDDVEQLKSSGTTTAVRILPPRDPYLLDRDRFTLVAAREIRKRIWTATPTDGLVLSANVPVASWKPRKRGTHLQLAVQPFERLTQKVIAGLEAEAASVAALRGCASFDVLL